MAKKEVIDYVKKELGKGFSLEKVKKKLKEVGYSQDDIDGSAVAATERKKLYFSKKVLFISILAVVIIVLATFSLKVDVESDGIKISPIQEDSGEGITETPKAVESPVEPETDYEKMYQDEFEKCVDKSLSSREYKCISRVTGNLSLCDAYLLENRSDKRDSCIDNYYLTRCFVDGNCLCDKTTGKDAKIVCEAFRNKNSEICDSCEDFHWATTCKAMLSENLDICEVEGEVHERDCKDSVLEILATRNKNISLCNNIVDNHYKIQCKALAESNPEICTEITNKLCMQDGTKVVDEQRLNDGANGKNIEICKKIIDENIRNSCISVVKNDLQLCKSVKNDDYKFYCLIQLGESLNKYEQICNELEGDMKQKCLEYYKNF
ncbi:MAG: hypothetical protein ABIC04_08725 [Nanoarchaeota archaeon]